MQASLQRALIEVARGVSSGLVVLANRCPVCAPVCEGPRVPLVNISLPACPDCVCQGRVSRVPAAECPGTPWVLLVATLCVGWLLGLLTLLGGLALRGWSHDGAPRHGLAALSARPRGTVIEVGTSQG